MKKIYTLAAFAFWGTVSFGQVTKMASPVIKSSKKVETTSPVQKAVVAGPFTFGASETWTTVINDGNDAWSVGTAAPSGSFSVGMGAITSTTAADNFAMFDSDLLGEDNNGTTPQNADIYYATPINLNGFNAVAVEFQSYYRAYQGNCYVIASTDGVNWTQVPVHTGIAVNSATTNPVLTTANVSAIIGGSTTAYIGFRYVGTWDYAWMVDDVSIVTLPDNDLGLLKGWQGDIINDYEYSMMPLAQVKPMIAGVVVENQGGQNQTTTLSWDILKDGVSTGTSGSQSITVNVGEIDTFWITTGYTPSANGAYSVAFSIPADMETSDDAFETATLKINDNLMAHDYGAQGAYGWNPTGSNSALANAPHAWGNLYIPTVNQDIYGIDVNFATGTSSGLYLLARVQQVPSGGSIQDPMTTITQVDYTIQPSDIGSAITTIVFPSPSTLVAGEAYVIDILKVDGTTGEGFYIGGSDSFTEDDDFSTVCYGPYGASSAVNYFVSWEFAPYVRANFDQTLSVPTIDENGVAVYPNPTTGVVNVSNEKGLNNTITVFDVTGKVMLTKVASTATSFDLSGFGSGVYLIEVTNEIGQSVQRVVVR